ALDPAGALPGRLLQPVCRELRPAQSLSFGGVHLYGAQSADRLLPALCLGLCVLEAAGGSAPGAGRTGGTPTMTAAFILVCSIGFLLMFFVSYCRSLLATSSTVALTQEVRDVAGIPSAVAPEDFHRVVQLLQLCPDRPEERGRVRTVYAYYRF